MPKIASALDPQFAGPILDADRVAETDELKIMTAAERIALGHAATVATDYQSRFATVVPPEDGPFADAVDLTVDRISGTLGPAIRADASTYNPVDAYAAVLATGPRAVSRGGVIGVVGEGQSGGAGELNFSQRSGDASRAPDYFDPAQDGAPVITTDRAGQSDTFDGTAIVPFIGAPFGAFDGNGPPGTTGVPGETVMHGFVGQLLARQPGLKLCVSVAGTRGATPLSGLRRPTNAEIGAGSMTASTGPIAIPAGSLEKQYRAAGISLRDLWTLTGAPATPWFCDAWSQSMICHLYELQGYPYAIGYMTMQHGETLPGEPYIGALADFYDGKQAAWREITGQSFDALMVMEVASYAAFLEIAGAAGYQAWVGSGQQATYAPGGPSSQYLADNARSNLQMFQRDLDIIAAQRFGGRRIVVSGAKYAMTNLIHHDQWSARWAGEVMAYRAWQDDFSGRPARALQAIAVTRQDDTHAVVHFDRRVQLAPPVRNGNTNFIRGVASGIPYGFSIDNIAIADNAVTLGADGYSVVIQTGVVLPPGAVLNYVNYARCGSVCSVDQLPLIYPDRDGLPTETREFCLPFSMVIA